MSVFSVASFGTRLLSRTDCRTVQLLSISRLAILSCKLNSSLRLSHHPHPLPPPPRWRIEDCLEACILMRYIYQAQGRGAHILILSSTDAAENREVFIAELCISCTDCSISAGGHGMQAGRLSSKHMSCSCEPQGPGGQEFGHRRRLPQSVEEYCHQVSTCHLFPILDRDE